MKKILASLFVFALFFFSLAVTGASARVISSEGNVDIATTEVINDDLFVGANTTQINGTVNGDVFVGSQTVIITGTINGNLHIGARTVSLSGKVSGNTYIGAQDILLNKAILGGSLIAGGANLNIDKDSSIGGSLIAGAASASVDSSVKRGAYLGTGNLTLGDNTKIGKDLYYATGNETGQANISESATVAGTIHRSEVKTPSKEVSRQQLDSALGGLRVMANIISFLGALLVGFLYMKFFGDHFEKTSNIVTTSFWKSLGIGFLVMIAFIPALIILLVTVIGVPVAGMAFLLILLYMYMAKIVVGRSLGGWISIKLNLKTSVFGMFALGLAAIYVLKMIPVIGWVPGMIVFLAGLGAFTIRLFSRTS